MEVPVAQWTECILPECILRERDGLWVRAPAWSLKHGCVMVARSWAVTSCKADQSMTWDERRLDMKGEWRSRCSPWDFWDNIQQRLYSRNQSFFVRLIKFIQKQTKSTIFFFINSQPTHKAADFYLQNAPPGSDPGLFYPSAVPIETCTQRRVCLAHL